MSLRSAAPLALVVLLVGCGSSEAASKPAATTTATASKLPDGSAATAEQAAYLKAIKPALSPTHAADALGLLRDGGDVCGISQTYALNLLQTAGGYNLTEATAIANAAPKYLCTQ